MSVVEAQCKANVVSSDILFDKYLSSELGGESQLIIIPPSGVNYEMFPAPAQFLFIYNFET